MEKVIDEKKKLMVVEDENSIAKQIKWGVSDLYDVTIVGNRKEACKFFQTEFYPVMTLDLGLPPSPDTPKEGLRLLEEMPYVAPYTKTIVITGNDEQEHAIKAIALGAVDFCSKPLNLEILKVILNRTFKIAEIEKAKRRLEELDEVGHSLCGMQGISSVMRELFNYIRQVSDTDYPVLIQGDSGTGKEMVANAIHQLSRRANRPLIVINCAAIPDNLLESEMFGHEKGSFTGATERKIGRFEHANKGTLFLDEIGDMPIPLQAKLLRFLQEDTIERIGGSETIQLDVRIIAATNVDLQEAVLKNRFREDLFYRLNVVPMVVPPLSDRAEDIIILAHHFIKEECRKLNRSKATLSKEATTALVSHSWTGNVRELQNRIRRALAILEGNMITPLELGLTDTIGGEDKEETETTSALVTLREARNEAERKAIQRALAETGSNISQAAKLLDVSRPTLHNLMKRYDLD